MQLIHSIWNRFIFKSTVSFALLFSLTISTIALWSSLSVGQPSPLENPSTLPTPANSSSLGSNLPSNFGNLIRASIVLDGRNIFDIASIDSEHHQKDNRALNPIQNRAHQIETQLYNAIALSRNPNSLKTRVETFEEQPIIVAADKGKLPNLPIMRVTAIDAGIHGFTQQAWAEDLSSKIRTALIQARQERLPSSLARQAFIAGATLLGLMVLSGLLFLLQKWLTRQRRNFQSRLVSAMPEALDLPDDSTAIATMTSSEAQRLAQLRWLDINSLKRLLILIALILVWVGGFAWIAGLFPYTRWAQAAILEEPIEILLIFLGTALALRMTNVFIDQSLKVFQERYFLESSAVRRQFARIFTYGTVLKGVIQIGIISIAIVLMLKALRIPIGPVLAGAGILGFAVSFGSQTLIKDVINGVLILSEDQFAVGDDVDLGDAKGTVEAVNLRVTKVRGARGRLSTVPNSSITVVHNMTKDWSRAEIIVEVNHDADVEKALHIMRQVTEEMNQEPDWSSKIIEPVAQLGVGAIARSGVLLKIWIKTQPGASEAVEREFYQRVKLAFVDRVISLGMHQKVWEW